MYNYADHYPSSIWSRTQKVIQLGMLPLRTWALAMILLYIASVKTRLKIEFNSSICTYQSTFHLQTIHLVLTISYLLPTTWRIFVELAFHDALHGSSDNHRLRMPPDEQQIFHLQSCLRLGCAQGSMQRIHRPLVHLSLLPGWFLAGAWYT